MKNNSKNNGTTKAVSRIPVKSDERQKLVGSTMDQIEKQFGQGSIIRMGDGVNMQIDVVPTGALPLDIALGVGGLPRGRVTEIFGPESSGKTTLALHAVAEAQRDGGICAYIDAEHALDPVYAGAIGVDVDELLVSQPDTGEQALEIADMLIRSGGLDMVVIDSVAALTPRVELEGDMGDAHVGLQARLMSQALRKLTANLNRTNTCCVFINQLREKVGVMFGSPETTPGGRALKFYSSVRLDIRRIESLKNGTDFIGSRTRVKVVKNKCAPPFKQAEFDIMYSQGISREGAVLDMAADMDIVAKSGAWYTYNKMQMGQGRENSKEFLTENIDVMAEITQKVIEKAMPAKKTESETAEPDGNPAKAASEEPANGKPETAELTGKSIKTEPKTTEPANEKPGVAKPDEEPAKAESLKVKAESAKTGIKAGLPEAEPAETDELVAAKAGKLKASTAA